VFQLLVTAKAVPSSPILVTMMMKAIRSSETSVFKRATLRNIPEEGITHTPYYSYNFWFCVLFEIGVLFCVIRVFERCLSVVPLPPGKVPCKTKKLNKLRGP
jgi:hypothetical protein